MVGCDLDPLALFSGLPKAQYAFWDLIYLRRSILPPWLDAVIWQGRAGDPIGKKMQKILFQKNSFIMKTGFNFFSFHK